MAKQTKTTLMLALALLALAGYGGAAQAAPKAKGKAPRTTADLPKALAQASFLDVRCTLPWMSADVAPLRRSWTPDKTDLLQRFFGGQQGVSSDQSVRSPIYGHGTRYKSGKVVYLTPAGMNTQAAAQKAEYVAAFLDLYSSGFSYQNNISHTPVHATDVQVTGVHSADVSRHDVYTVSDGQAAAEKMIGEMFGKLSVPSGFQTSVDTVIQDFGEQLFVYRVTPEFITQIQLTAPNGQKQTIQSGLPLFETFVNIQLDGEKLLAGMEYYWDNNLTVSGPLKPSIDSFEAVAMARTGLLKEYNNSPPLLTVTAVKLGYIVDRKQPSQLIPAWVFDASYTKTVTQPGKSGFNTTDLQVIPLPFAIHALSGDLIPLWK